MEGFDDSTLNSVIESHYPFISYRPLRPSDLKVLEKIHGELFPFRYEPEFFQDIVNGGNGIVSWGAVDCNRTNGKSDELIGFVTTEVVFARGSEVDDFVKFDPSKPNETVVYILTLGVLKSYRKLGIATSLISLVIDYATSMQTCKAVYLHVVSDNAPAISLYKKMSFKCIRRLCSFYPIEAGQRDAFLYIYYLNGGRSPRSLIEAVTLLISYAKGILQKSITAIL
ncbi:unnamed protein product [Cuscuta epithymum]|uniref:N-alpha-acetyltransferase 60 n=1 Tax=Cuscuta epithymum TaxID=186058 RepID=A0AAV0FYK3_9ASTE|nr:unnamed protein product [Cuscuta epithymum]